MELGLSCDDRWVRCVDWDGAPLEVEEEGLRVVVGDVGIKMDGQTGVLCRRVSKQQVRELLLRHVEGLRKALNSSSRNTAGRRRGRASGWNRRLEARRRLPHRLSLMVRRICGLCWSTLILTKEGTKRGRGVVAECVEQCFPDFLPQGFL